MEQSLSFAELQNLMQMSADQRYDYLLAQAKETQKLWILVGDGGSVLLSSEGQSYVPVWPHQVLAEAHIQDDWSDCDCLSISVEDWQLRWTEGLKEDKLYIAGFIDEAESGVIVSPDEFHEDLLANMQGDD